MSSSRKSLPGWRAAMLAASVFCSACQQAPPTLTSEQLYVFGTVVEIQIADKDTVNARAAINATEAEFRRMHRDLHAWEPGLLFDVNRAFAGGRAVDAGSEIAGLVEWSQQAEQASMGCFNPAIGALIGLWGFHTSDYPILGPPPSESEIERLVANKPSTMDIRIDGYRLNSRNTTVQLDFGGIAKGYAIDRAVEILQDHGIDNAMVNAGGDLRAIGHHVDRPWRVAIQHPAGGLVGVLAPGDGEAVFTSGVYERYRQDNEERFPHIIDPRSGRPVSTLASVTVVDQQGVWADAAATALTVAGPDEWLGVAESMNIQQVLIIDEAGNIQVSETLHHRMEYAEGIEEKISLVALPRMQDEN